MRIHLLSDLHLEVCAMPKTYTPPEADVVILAGDISSSRGPDPFKWIEETYKGRDVIYVAGNHEFYRGVLNPGYEIFREMASKIENLHFLENDEVTIKGQHFVGCTLWTDFDLYGDPADAAVDAKFGMNDFRLIGDMTIQTWLTMYKKSYKFLEEKITPETIAVTHFLPSIKSVHAKYLKEPKKELNPAFASNTLDRLPIKPKAWFHGHTHDSFDYIDQGCHVMCNPRGYGGYEVNDLYSMEKVFDV